MAHARAHVETKGAKGAVVGFLHVLERQFRLASKYKARTHGSMFKQREPRWWVGLLACTGKEAVSVGIEK